MTTGPGETEYAMSYVVDHHTLRNGSIEKCALELPARGTFYGRAEPKDRNYCTPKECVFFSVDEAMIAAEKLRTKRILSLRKQIARLQELEFRIA